MRHELRPGGSSFAVVRSTEEFFRVFLDLTADGNHGIDEGIQFLFAVALGGLDP